jgi:hypothetical protein
LTGLQAQIGGQRSARAGAPSAVALVCLILLAFLAVVQVAHVHPLDTDADHCPLCIVMHSAAPVAVATVVVVLVRIGAPAPVLAVRAAILPYWHPSVFIRPPPVG